MKGKTRDFREVRAILNEKTRHCHGRDSENPVKMHAKVTSCSENPVKIHTTKSDARSNSGCGLRPKAYRTKRTLGRGPYREKSLPRVQIQGAVKAEGLQHKENPGPPPLPGKTRDFYDAHPLLKEKTRHSHGQDSANPVKMH